ncbi:UPF0182 protein [Pilimelia terevasa]|uniref:UPF0182 protein GCM10010124_07110 n=1 Tax=Pilimelia terevasa TaxID=53372 RepID=A0A8J3FF91_9ACTN|nr:UPF0182 family protein [Pilimelia terevasa]GGK17140.1 UPF0182 protein [Pilimelia terevasa]
MVMRNAPLPRVNRRGRAGIVVVAGAFLLFTVLGWVVQAYTDWLWFDEVRFTDVFSRTLTTRTLLFLSFGLGMGAVVGANLYLAYRLRPLLRPHSDEQATLERYRMLLTPRIATWIALPAAAVGVFAGLSAQSQWGQWLLFRHGGDFGVADPEFGVDVGFYVFAYPFWRYLVGTVFTALVLALIGALAVHYVFGGVRLQGVGDRMTNGARAHLTTLVALFVATKAVAYLLDRRGLLLGHNEATNLYGAGYTDVNALLPAKEILAYISVLVAIAILVFSHAIMRNLLWPGIALALLGVSAVAIGGLYPAGVQYFSVRPSVPSKEATYIDRSIKATQAAFGMTDVRSTGYAGRNTAPREAMFKNDKAVVPHIRLLDPDLVSETFTALQQVRSVYDFGEKLDIDRYTVDNRTQDYVVGVREVADRHLTGQQRVWQNRHTVYTHGYGLVAAPANQICNGQPAFVSGFLTDDPNTGGDSQCNATVEKIPVKEPRVYYGEQLPPYAVVGKEDGGRDVEFDRPTSTRQTDTGEEQVNFTYAGTGGIEVGSFARRLLYAIRFTEGNFLLSNAVNENSKLLYVRDPRSRVQKVAPFLTLDGDPYPAVVDGRIQWIVDGYTTAATYPYAQQVDLAAATSDASTGRGTVAQQRQDVNYIRNSVKATVDAYDGTVNLYAFDEDDPVLKAWNAAFGGDLVKPRSAIPPALMQHLRYPADLFKVQRNLFSRFHVTDSGAFYRESDLWQVPNSPAAPDAGVKQPPYYLLTQLPGQTAPRFQLTAALSPKDRQNLAAVMAGSYDADGRPTLQVSELPSSSVVAGPIQVHQEMVNDGQIRPVLVSLGADNKAIVEFGNLLSLPFDDGMLYVEPVYVKSTANLRAYPTLQFVMLSYGDTKAIAPTLAEGIAKLIAAGRNKPGGGTPPGPGPTPTPTPTATPGPTTPAPLPADLAAAAAEVDRAIAEVRSAQQAGDFVRYGRALQQLETAMQRFQAVRAAASPGSR